MKADLLYRLIDKDYMERDDEAHNTYNYVA